MTHSASREARRFCKRHGHQEKNDLDAKGRIIKVCARCRERLDEHEDI